MGYVEANDGTRLHCEESGSGPPLVLLHGWTFSGRFFDRNVAALAQHAQVLTVNLRGHGDSDKPEHGYRIARLAKDLHDLLEARDLHTVTVLGWSLGCPVIWSYLELFGTHRLAAAVFVQQTPRQYYAVDWTYAHSVCFDDAALAALQAQVSADPRGQDHQQLGQRGLAGQTPLGRRVHRPGTALRRRPPLRGELPRLGGVRPRRHAGLRRTHAALPAARAGARRPVVPPGDRPVTPSGGGTARSRPRR